MSHTVFCKTMENIVYEVDIRLLTNEKYFLK